MSRLYGLPTGVDLSLHGAFDGARIQGWRNHVRQEIEKFFFAEPAHAEHVLEGLRKAGLNV